MTILRKFRLAKIKCFTVYSNNYIIINLFSDSEYDTERFPVLPRLNQGQPDRPRIHQFKRNPESRLPRIYKDRNIPESQRESMQHFQKRLEVPSSLCAQSGSAANCDNGALMGVWLRMIKNKDYKN